MAFSGEGRGLNKNILVKTIQTMNQHLPNRRLNLTELLAMEKPGIRKNSISRKAIANTKSAITMIISIFLFLCGLKVTIYLPHYKV